jgi:hypothetical protein
MIQAQTLDQVMMQWSKLREVTIKLQLEKSGRGYMLSIFEDGLGNSFNGSNLDKQVKWVTEQLDGQASRRAWNMWKFKNKRDAEKFITMYYLVWGQ